MPKDALPTNAPVEYETPESRPGRVRPPRKKDKGKAEDGEGQHPDVELRPMQEHVDLDPYSLAGTNAWHLTYADIISFIRGEHALCDVMLELQKNDAYIFNPPTPQEIDKMVSLAIRRKKGKINTEDAPSSAQRANARENPSPDSANEYADQTRQAFPVDSKERATSAHAYIHKYWNSPSKNGITASYNREDFVKVHKNIIVAMNKFNIEHQYLDSLDDASGIKKPEDKKEQPAKQLQTSVSPRFHDGQKVVSFSRGRLQEIGTIRKIDGLVAQIEWGCGLETSELLARLIPIS